MGNTPCLAFEKVTFFNAGFRTASALGRDYTFKDAESQGYSGGVWCVSLQDVPTNRCPNLESRWWFQIFFVFSPRSLGKILILTNIFEIGLKPPTRNFLRIFSAQTVLGQGTLPQAALTPNHVLKAAETPGIAIRSACMRRLQND